MICDIYYKKKTYSKKKLTAYYGNKYSKYVYFKNIFA